VLLQPDAGICMMAGTRPESRPGVDTRPETGVQPDAGIDLAYIIFDFLIFIPL